MPAVGDVLRCQHCGRERPFVRPPLLIVTGTVGIGKSTLCAQLAGTVPGVVFLDADVFAEDMISVAPPNRDYEAFWLSMMRLAHEVAQNNAVVVYFSTMLPEQVLANRSALSYFDGVHFLCLTCPRELLQARLARRDGARAAAARTAIWADFDSTLTAAARELATATVVDAGRAASEVEHDIRDWVNARLGPGTTTS